MESSSTSGGVIRRTSPLSGTFRYNPYALGIVGAVKEDMKEEVVRLGVELSVSLAESMFLLCDHVPSMLWFCFKLWRFTLPPSDPVSERLLRVSHYVYSNNIKNRNSTDGVNQSIQSVLVRTIWPDFIDGIVVLHRLVLALRGNDCSFDDRLLLSAISKYKLVLKKLEDNLTMRRIYVPTSMNGFSRETTKSNISNMWKSLFDKEAGETETPEAARSRIVNELFQPILSGEYSETTIPTLAVLSPHILGKDFAKEEMREESVQLGVELSLYVAESMFLLSDDIRSMLRFSLKLWTVAMSDLTPCSPVVERLLRVISYVYSRKIKPKNGIYQIGGRSAQRVLITATWENLDSGIRDLHKLVSILQGQGSWEDGLEFKSSIEETLTKIEEKLSCAKDVSKANGFNRDAMVSKISVFWNFLFNQPTEEAWALKVRRDDIISAVFKPLFEEEAAKH